MPTLKNLYDLVGYTLIDLSNSQMTVEKNGIRYILDFVIVEGDCCGYSTIENNLFFKKKRKENPVITRVEYNRDDQASEEDYLNVTFFGMNKAICEINSTSSSGSGWAYGSAVTIKCKALQFEEMLTEW